MMADDRKLLGAVAMRKEYLLAEALAFTINAISDLSQERRAQSNIDQMKAILASLSPEAQRAAQGEAQNWLKHFRRD
jgi:hypothetical protein